MILGVPIVPADTITSLVAFTVIVSLFLMNSTPVAVSAEPSVEFVQRMRVTVAFVRTTKLDWFAKGV